VQKAEGGQKEVEEVHRNGLNPIAHATRLNKNLRVFVCFKPAKDLHS
jgi:hypothetical protein